MVAIVCLAVTVQHTRRAISISFPLCILSGMILGPYGMEVVEHDMLELASHYGLIMMLFSAGLKVNIKQLASTAVTSVWVLVVEIVCALVFCSICKICFAFEWKVALLWAFVFILSSTVCALQIMEQEGGAYNPYVMGVLIVQDMSLPVMIILLRSVDNILDISVFSQVVTKVVVGVMPLLLVLFARYLVGDGAKYKVTRSWVIPAGMVGWCVLVALFFERWDLSSEYGAFLAGLAFGLWFDARKASLVIYDFTSAVSIAFFLCIGMMVNLAFIVEYLPTLVAMVFAMFVAKTFTNGIGFGTVVQGVDNMQSGILLATLSELSFSLIGVSDVRGFYMELIQSCVIVCMLLSMAWYQLLIRCRRVW